jgi:hypothetical protein
VAKPQKKGDVALVQKKRGGARRGVEVAVARPHVSLSQRRLPCQHSKIRSKRLSQRRLESSSRRSRPKGLRREKCSECCSVSKTISETGKQTLLDYKTLEGHVAKRTFYYDRFLSLPKENARFEARKTHGSDKTWSEREKDMGWVEEDFIAARKGLTNYKNDPEQAVKLGYWLGLCKSRPHPCRDNLANKEACQYHYMEAADEIVKSASEGVRFDLRGDMDPAEQPDILRAAGALENGSSESKAAGRESRGSSKGAGGPRPLKHPKKEEPEWLASFKKDGLHPLQVARSSASSLLSKVQDAILQFSLSEEEKITDNDLLKMYVKELQKAASVLEKEMEALKRWLLKKGTSPSEASATAWKAEFKNRADDLKRHKEAFDNVTKHKMAELMQCLK